MNNESKQRLSIEGEEKIAPVLADGSARTGKVVQESILIIDDEDDLITLLRYIFQADNYCFTQAYNGYDGLKLALETNPDLILLDMHMPVMSGVEVLAKLNEKDVQIPIIFMTSFGSTETAVQAFRLGVRHYLPKPFEVDRLRHTVAEVLRQIGQQRQQKVLQDNRIAAEAVRQTVVTLAHHINNQLMVVETSLSLMAEKLLHKAELQSEEDLKQMIARSQAGTERITAVLKVLQQITSIEPTTYFDSTQMLDIEAAVEQQLHEMSSDLGQR